MASTVAKHTPIYNLTVHYENRSKEGQTLELSSPFTRWFDADGFFVAKPFQQWLASEIPLISQVDPQNNPRGSGVLSDATGKSEIAASVEQQKYDTPKKTSGSDPRPTSAKARKGRKTPDG